MTTLPAIVTKGHPPLLLLIPGPRRKALFLALPLPQHRDNPACSPGFYTYEAFKQAVAAFPAFATASHNPIKNKRELAAFLAQIAQETTGGWPTAPNGELRQQVLS